MVASAAALIGASPGVSAAQSAAPTQASFSAHGLSVKRLTAAVQMTKDDPPPARAFTAPSSMLVDPNDPRIVVAATADMRTRLCYLLRSTDAGATWHIPAASPSLKDYPYCTSGNAAVANTSLAWGRNHTLYYALEGYGDTEGGRSGHISILLARSADLGTTWSTSLVDNTRPATGVAPSDSGGWGLAVDSSGPSDVVYVGFSQSFPTAPTGSPLLNGRLAIAVSTDNGRTFAPSVNLNDSSHVTATLGGQSFPLLMSGGPFMAVHNGVVEVVSGSRTMAGVTVPPPTTNPGISNYAMPQLVARSTDQGKTWNVTTLGPPVFTPVGSQTGLNWTPKGGPTGSFVAVYTAAPATADTSGATSVFFQRSVDNGQTWSAPVFINDENLSQQFTNFYPELGVAANGRIDVVWENNRQLADYQMQVGYTYSTDGGVTWSPNIQVSDQPIDFNHGVSFNSDIRQPPGVASANQYVAIGWADPRLDTGDSQTQDDYAAVAQFTALPATSSSFLPRLAAVFGGLLFAGAVFVLLLWYRRRDEGVRVPPRVDQEAPVDAVR